MIATALAVLCAATSAGNLPASPVALPDAPVEKQLVVSITTADLEGAVLSEITWDEGALLLQGIIANPDGSLSGRYAVVPAKGTTLAHLKEQSDKSLAYWNLKSNRVSPTGIGRIQSSFDSKLPMYGIGSVEQRISDATDMGGMQRKHFVKLGRTVLHEREDGQDPYDGEIWSWSPAELNRIAYVDAKGDLWVAAADGSKAQRLLKGHFTLPAWSDDGKAIAVAEKKDGGRRWDLFVVLLPENLRTPAK
jgi:hypothetical protein